MHLTSPDRVYRSWQSRHRAGIAASSMVRRPSHLHRLIPPDERCNPIVSVHDAASHSLAWIGSAVGTRQVSLGVDRFGESGTIPELHSVMGLSTGHIINAALVTLYEEEPLAGPSATSAHA